MSGRRYRIPSSSALLAFECAARHCNFSRAAEELCTSQSAISRHIAALERDLDTRLFDRDSRRLSLTEQGELYFRAVVSSLEGIQSASYAIANTAGTESLVIACTHEISHLVVMPRFEALQRAVGESVHIRVMTYEYDSIESERDPRVDITFGYHSATAEVSNVVFRESVVPVCSPGFMQKHGGLLTRDTEGWSSLPFLQLSKRNLGWATWQDWFDHAGFSGTPDYLAFDNYVYLLEAAVAGRGLALGWRGLVDRYLQTAALVCVVDEFIDTGRVFCAELTTRGRKRGYARAALDYLVSIDGD